MKTTVYSVILVVIMSLGTLSSFSQFNPNTNTFGTPVVIPAESFSQPAETISYAPLSGVPCSANTFWAINANSSNQYNPTFDAYTLSAGVITKTGSTTISKTFNPSLAYCNNLNGGAFSPTFYSTLNSRTPAYFDGTGVTSSSSTFKEELLNPGGYANYLYYISYDSITFKSKAIVRYNGSGFNTVYSFPSAIEASVADLAIDVFGNVWLFTGPDNASLATDTLKVISPAGTLLHSFPFAYGTYNAYGCFLLEGTLYIGLGSANPLHANTLVPVTITAAGATAGTPIAVPGTVYNLDLASCSPGAPLSVNELPSLSGITVYPNPVKDRLTIQNNTNENLVILVSDVNGKELFHQSFSGYLNLDTEKLSPGIYLYKILNKDGVETKGKFVKE